MKTAPKAHGARKSRREILDDALPQFEQFIESRESYIKALETAIEALRTENQRYNKNSLEIRSSIDELVAMQRLSNSIGAAVQPEQIVTTLIDLTKQVIPVLDSNIFLFQEGRNKLLPLASRGTESLNTFASAQVEAGIADWVVAEKKTVIIPDIDSLGAQGTSRNFVIVPLILRNRPIGIFVIHTEKPQTDFSNQDIQLLSVLATQAAAGVENWRTYDELMNANEQLKASQAQMIQAAKLAAIGELAASVVHEIKNPLQIMMMHLEMVERGRPLPNWTELLGQQVKRLSEIAKRLMNFARNVADDVLMESVNVNKAIEDVVAIIQHDFKSSNITVALDLAPELPTIAGNANYLQQVFLNLAINARDAMAKGGTFSVKTRVKGTAIRVDVSDTGSGIAPENMEKIFFAFFTTKELGKGTGLGLAVCSKIVERHGGKISVTSEAGKGTTFTVTLPLRRAQ
jgi:signal transduction histidine kinase